MFERERSVESAKIRPYLVEEKITIARYATSYVDHLDVVHAVRASHFDQVFADVDATAEGCNLATRTAYVETEAVKLEAEVAALADQTFGFFAWLAAVLLTEVRVGHGCVATEPNDHPAIGQKKIYYFHTL